MKKKWLLPVVAGFMIFSTLPKDSVEAATAAEVTATAYKYIGIPYLYGGTTTRGLDCSGFTQKVFTELGIKLNRSSAAQYKQGTSVSKAKLQVGDLLFFNTSGRGVSHVAIYIGNGKMIHSQSNKGVSVSNLNDPYYWGSRYIGAKRVATLETKKVVEVVSKAKKEVKKEVKNTAVNSTTYASRAEVAKQLATIKKLNTSNKASGFKDVKTTHPNAGPIAAVKKAGYFSGSHFSPATPITRGVLAMVLVNAFNLEEGAIKKTFSDVPASHSAHKAVKILSSNGIIIGYSNGKFGVNDKVSLTQLATIIKNAQKKSK